MSKAVGLALALVLCAAPPARRATELAQKAAWEELYLAFSAARAEDYPARERRPIGAALRKGATALERSDAVMAYSLADRALAFDPSADAHLLLGRTARASGQPDAAERALRQGALRHPRHPGLALALGQFLVDEQQHAEALKVLEQVRRGTKEHARARALQGRARAALAEERQAQAQAKAVQRKLDATVARTSPSGSVAPAGGGPGAPSSGYQSSEGPAGMRTRANQRFVFRYFANDRDFGQRAEYEGRATAALEEAAAFAERLLGTRRQAPLDVVLYTHEEFRAHYGDAAASRIAGLYSMGAIRMNRAEEFTPQVQATLVHEYVHAVVDDRAGGNPARIPRWLHEGVAEYAAWRFQGSDDPPHAMRVRLRGLAAREQLSPLARLSDDFHPTSSDAAVAYAHSAVAVRLLLERGGPENLFAFLRDLAEGKAYDDAYRRRYGGEPHALDERLRRELGAR